MNLREMAQLPGNEQLKKGVDAHDYAVFLSGGGPFKVANLGNYADWDPQALKFASVLAQYNASTYNLRARPGTDRYEEALCDEEYDELWDPKEYARLRGIHQALVRATAQANDRAYQKKQNRGRQHTRARRKRTR
jgi:hypothetical protein